MALEKVSTILKTADKAGYGVAAFNCHNYESIATVINTAEELKMPVIVMMYPTVYRHIPVSTFAAITKDLARKVKVPVGLHLDHSHDFDFIMAAIHEGFQSVIVDASSFPYAENAGLTRQVVKAAHPMGVDVEAEIGFVGSGANAADYVDSSKYTDPAEALRFAEETGVDSLAVAIGNGHGHYAVEPHLDIERLQAIDELVPVPLVLHGGSGIPDDQVAASVAHGMVKFNFGTNYGGSIFAAQERYMADPQAKKNSMGLLAAGQAGGKEFVAGRINLLNPKGVTVV
ncbi:MAG: class II fructose-bisphosphate aldolase [Christensenellales bacterium]|jgi:ketose-bisphosphate aldolase